MNEIWTAKECAEYLRCSYSTFMKRLRWQPGFPDPLEWSTGGELKWSAEKVKSFALEVA